MAAYIWTPFPSMNVGAMTLLGKINAVHDLSTLNVDDVLYISAHHNKFLPHIGDNEGNKLNVYELCDVLKDGGLKAGHQCIKLWLCYAGYGMQARQGFGYQFWYTMNTIYGYNNLTVFAYTELTVDPIYDKHKMCYNLTQRPGEGPVMTPLGRAKNYRVGMRHNGTFIPLGAN